uniref:ARAD1C38621p n=1 Tax=Blastobotrys adeninivorans TaxID=409370 RepID=A0A060T9K7_BLAAD
MPSMTKRPPPGPVGPQKYVPIRPCLRPLLPKPPTTTGGSTTTNGTMPPNALNTGAKRPNSKKKDRKSPTTALPPAKKARTKSEPASMGSSLPSTVSPASLMCKKRFNSPTKAASASSSSSSSLSSAAPDKSREGSPAPSSSSPSVAIANPDLDPDSATTTAADLNAHSLNLYTHLDLAVDDLPLLPLWDSDDTSAISTLTNSSVSSSMSPTLPLVDQLEDALLAGVHSTDDDHHKLQVEPFADSLTLDHYLSPDDETDGLAGSILTATIDI